MDFYSMRPIGKQRYDDMLKEGLHEQEVKRHSPQKRLAQLWKRVMFIIITIVALIHFLPLW